jgi:hypothetical protein
MAGPMRASGSVMASAGFGGFGLGSDISCFLEHQEIVVGRGGDEVVGDLESDVAFSLREGHCQGVGCEGGLEDVAGTERS